MVFINALYFDIANVENSLDWTYLDTIKSSGSAKTVTQYLSGNFREILLVLQEELNGAILASTVITASKTSATQIRAIYRTSNGDLRYAQFIRSTAVLSVSEGGYDAILYAR